MSYVLLLLFHLGSCMGLLVVKNIYPKHTVYRRIPYCPFLLKLLVVREYSNKNSRLEPKYMFMQTRKGSLYRLADSFA